VSALTQRSILLNIGHIVVWGILIQTKRLYTKNYKGKKKQYILIYTNRGSNIGGNDKNVQESW